LVAKSEVGRTEKKSVSRREELGGARKVFRNAKGVKS